MKDQRESDLKRYPLLYFCPINAKHQYQLNLESKDQRSYKFARIIIHNAEKRDVKLYHLNFGTSSKQPSQQGKDSQSKGLKQRTMDDFVVRTLTEDNDNGSFHNFISNIGLGRSPGVRPKEKEKSSQKTLDKDPAKLREEEQMKKALKLSQEEENKNQFNKAQVKQLEELQIEQIKLKSLEGRRTPPIGSSILQFEEENSQSSVQILNVKPHEQLKKKDEFEQPSGGTPCFGLKYRSVENNDLGYGDCVQKPKSPKWGSLISYGYKQNSSSIVQDQVILKFMTPFKAHEIDRDFLDYHSQMELSRGKPMNQLLRNIMYTSK